MMKKAAKTILYGILAFALLLSGSAAYADTVTLPASLTALGADAFRGDASLDEVIIPEGVTAIPSGAFADSSLRAIHIPASVGSIAENAFSGASPAFYLADLNSFSGNLDGKGTVHLTQDAVIFGDVTFANATLLVDAGVTLTVYGSLAGSRLIIDGTVVNCGSVTVTESLSTGEYGTLSIPDWAAFTAIPAASYCEGLCVQAVDGALITLSFSGESETFDTIVPGSLTAEIVRSGDRVRFCFVPRVSGSYTLSSIGSDDTLAYLYDASMTKITSDDDSGDNRNFSITYKFTANTVYYFEVFYYYSYKTGVISLALSADFHDAEITSHPQSVTAAPDETAVFHVTATGTSLAYQWQVMTSGSGVWEDAELNGSDTDTLSFTVLQSHNIWKFRCRVTGKDGIAVYSDSAALYVSSNQPRYRALLISEVAFDPVCNRNEGDVQAMKRMLQSVTGPSGDDYTIVTRKNLSSSGVQAAISEAFSGATIQDVSLFFIATHGDISHGVGSPDAGALETPFDNDRIPFGDLAQWLGAVPGKVIVIVGSCGSGAAIYSNGRAAESLSVSDEEFAQSLIDVFSQWDEDVSPIRSNTGELRVPNKFYVLAASALQQESWGYEGSNPNNYFTLWLTDGVGVSGSMPADYYYGNRDGVLTLEELYSYISAVGDNCDIVDSNGNIHHQTVKRYPEHSDYQLFTR